MHFALCFTPITFRRIETTDFFFIILNNSNIESVSNDTISIYRLRVKLLHDKIVERSHPLVILTKGEFTC